MTLAPQGWVEAFSLRRLLSSPQQPFPINPHSIQLCNSSQNPRSGCRSKAWGGAQRNPRNPSLKKLFEPAERATEDEIAKASIAR